MYLYGKFLIKQNNIIDGIIYIKKAANLGDIKSIHLFGYLLFNYGINQNKKKEGFEYVLNAAKKGNKKSLYFCVNQIKNIDDKIYKEELINLLKKSANDGDQRYKYFYEIFIDNEKNETDIKKVIKYLKI